MSVAGVLGLPPLGRVQLALGSNVVNGGGLLVAAVVVKTVMS